ncbi:hypothetical protein ABZ690_24535 [Streptomyces sp. NPDC006967]|uniref:hypothetical protein n=1 Tax=unclassified Streptomyces TaxID=2593676 RepID=UPI000CD57B06|nr:hypothetical protein [Streptomyces sp. SM1]
MKSPHGLWSDPADAEALKVRLDDLHRAKIRLADEVLVVGDPVTTGSSRLPLPSTALDPARRFVLSEM